MADTTTANNTANSTDKNNTSNSNSSSSNSKSEFQIKEYYTATDDDLKCNHCGQLPPNGIDPNLILLLNEMSTVMGFKVPISNAYRCPDHNDEVPNAAKQSYHTKGMAADTQNGQGWSNSQLYRLAVHFGATGADGYEWGVHVDVRNGLVPDGTPVNWNDDGKRDSTDGGTEEAEQALANAGVAKSSAASVTYSSAGGGTGNAGANLRSIKKTGNLRMEVNPVGKTYCEPIYPDLLSIPGNIPASTVDVSKSTASASGVTSDMNYIVSAENNGKLTGLDVSGFVDQDKLTDRQKIYDASADQYKVFKTSSGLPFNCCDPYPVDLKIEELETHMPKVKVDGISFSKPDGNTVTLAEQFLYAADSTEKRIVKLENILATVMRYCFGIGRRLNINCIYYGGQDRYQKYKCIRCKRDDMNGDGQIMQIDQCLSCTRYEPFLGQTYDILNEVGANQAAILDIDQTGHIDMQEYAKLTKIDKKVTQLTDIKFDPTRNKIRIATDKPFSYNTNNNGANVPSDSTTVDTTAEDESKKTDTTTTTDDDKKTADATDATKKEDAAKTDDTKDTNDTNKDTEKDKDKTESADKKDESSSNSSTEDKKDNSSSNTENK
jgi:uncharacterized protein YcbK (DUF882 family)